MKLKDILPRTPVVVEVRTNGPNDEDMLFGYCRWDGQELHSIDGDSYYLDMEVVSYKLDADSLTCWMVTHWLSL